MLKSIQSYSLQGSQKANYPCAAGNSITVMSNTYIPTGISCGDISRTLTAAGTGQVCPMGAELTIICPIDSGGLCVGTVSNALDLDT